MGLASTNIGIEGMLIANKAITPPNSSDAASTNPYFNVKGYSSTLDNIFHIGDEIFSTTSGLGLAADGVTPDNVGIQSILDYGTRLWVVGFNSNKTGVLLMDRHGNYINKCNTLEKFPFKIVRSGYRNLQEASMASVTSMRNPIDIDGIGAYNNIDKDSFIFNETSSFNPRIINASAVVYKDFWRPQDESNLPYYPEYNTALSASSNPITEQGDVNYPYKLRVNPFVWNIKDDWKAEKSYAYLAGRNASAGQVNNPRNEGFYNRFAPFYQLISGSWAIVNANWTDASSVTLHSPYGAELENKDALERYSAAQYGHSYTLPMAVASNSRYQQVGYEGFEEKKSDVTKKHFGFQVNQNDISTTQSHTGKNSIKVNKGQSVSLNRVLTPAIKTIEMEKCPATTGGNGGVTTIQCPILMGPISSSNPENGPVQYGLSITVDFGANGPHPTNTLSFASGYVNNTEHFFSFEPNESNPQIIQIDYSGTNLVSTTLILTDSQGLSKSFNLVILGEGYQIHGCANVSNNN
jgi:hypothetical protein